MISKLTEKHLSPVAIGGVGGSGTRLIAQCLKDLGFFIGSDLNRANDNLWFTLLFKRIEILESSVAEFNELVGIFYKGMTGTGQFTETEIDSLKRLTSLDSALHSAEWLQERVNSLLSEKHILEPHARWGWKEPNTHVVIDRFRNAMPNMKYIHVMRNGLDMAHSLNQNQIKLWGKYFIGSNHKVSPFYSLKYWCVVHRRILDISKSIGKNFYLLNYDNLTLHPEEGLREFLRFLDLNVSDIQLNKLLSLIKIPESIGRYKQYGTDIFDEIDVALVKQLGFAIDTK